jgi:hypothetical protein
MACLDLDVSDATQDVTYENHRDEIEGPRSRRPIDERTLE